MAKDLPSSYNPSVSILQLEITQKLPGNYWKILQKKNLFFYFSIERRERERERERERGVEIVLFSTPLSFFSQPLFPFLPHFQLENATC